MHMMDATLIADVKIENVSAWCREHGVDRRTFYRHRARVAAEGAWVQRSRRPKHTPNATPDEVVADIVRLRAALAPENGADPIRDALGDLATRDNWAARGWTVPSRATINRILGREGLLDRNPKKRPKSSYRRFSYAQPRDCYQIDATEITLANNTTVVVFDVLDDATRALVACLAAPAETLDAAVAAITAARDEFGAPAIVLSDNGAAFTNRYRNPQAGPSKFARTVTGWGSRVILSSPYHPQTCGKVERHHQTFKKWLTAQPVQPSTLAQLQTLADAYRQHYNTRRRHSSIGRRTPGQAWADAPSLGGPQHLPMQTDATVHRLKVSTQGTINLGKNKRLRIGATYSGETVTIIQDHDRAAAYTTDGDPIGSIHLDHTKTYQGKLIPAA
jgi:transposase InsO family protein